MRRRYVQIDGVLYERGRDPRPAAPEIMPDIAPYRSMLTGEWITSRSRHRDHLRDHNAIEIGNETKYLLAPKPPLDPAPQSRHELIREQINAMTYDQLRDALRRDIDGRGGTNPNGNLRR